METIHFRFAAGQARSIYHYENDDGHEGRNM